MQPAMPIAVRVRRAAHRFIEILAKTHPAMRHDEREAVRAFTFLILILLVVHTLVTPIWLLTTRNVTLVPSIVVINTCLLVASLVISRTRRYRIAIYTVVALSFVTVTLIAFDDAQRGTSPIVISKFYVFCVLLAAFMLHLRGLLAMSVLSLAMVILFNFIIPRSPVMASIGEVAFSILTSALIILGRYTRDMVAARLRTSEQRYRALFEQSNDAILLITPDGRIVEANLRAADMLGYDVSQLQTMICTDLVVERERQHVMDIRRKLLTGEQFVVYERTFLRYDGAEILTEMSPALIIHPTSGAQHIQLIIRDISARKQAERSAIRAAIEQERGLILAQFVRGASHEFRTPLSIIGTNVHLLRRPLADSDRQRRLDSVLAQSERINRLVNMMLLMVRLDTGEPFELVSTSLRDLLGELSYHFETRAAGRLRLEIMIDLDLPRLNIDRYFFTEALRHLLTNAIQYTQGEGTVTLSAMCVLQPSQVIIRARDPGIGIHPSLHERIFERFFRADEAYSVEGFGLGLSIVRAVVERHGGTITVESAPGAGSTFCITLPAVPTSGT